MLSHRNGIFPIILSSMSAMGPTTTYPNSPSPMAHSDSSQEDHKLVVESGWGKKDYYTTLWVEDLYLGPDFKPNVVPRPKRQSFLTVERRMVHPAYANKSWRATKPTLSVRKENKKQVDVPTTFETAMSWFPVEPQFTTLTEDFIKATTTPYEKRSLREHEVISIYWHRGLSLDPIMKYENGELTQAILEGSSEAPEFDRRSSEDGLETKTTEPLPILKKSKDGETKEAEDRFQQSPAFSHHLDMRGFRNNGEIIESKI